MLVEAAAGRVGSTKPLLMWSCRLYFASDCAWGNPHMKTFCKHFWNDEQGQDLIEYTLMLAFVALASAALFSSAGASVNKIWSKTNSQLSNAAGS
jgi:Flp pilus assembly pilin Flp